MSNMEQMRDNLSYIKNFDPRNSEKQNAIRKVQEVMGGIKSIPCKA